MKCIKCGEETGAAWKTLCRVCWKNQTPEEIRTYRQQKLDKKVARLKAKSERLQKEANGKLSVMDQYWGDTAFLTQPANPNKGFGKQRAKIYARYDKGLELSIEADKVKEKAEWLERGGVAVKGDAERKRQAKRDANDKIISVGSKVYDSSGGEGEVIKVNKKTYTIKFVRGFTWNQDKSWVELVKEKAA